VKVKRVKVLEYKNTRLKKMYEDLSLENRGLKDLIDRKL